MGSTETGLRVGRPIPRWFPLALLASGVVFALHSLLWELGSTAPLFWGDSFTNAESLLALASDLEHVPFPAALFDLEVHSRAMRPPGMFHSALAWLQLVGFHHGGLVAYQTLWLIGAGWLLGAAVAERSGDPWVGLGATWLFWGAPASIMHAHAFHHAPSTAFFVAAALWSYGRLGRSRASVLALGLSLGLGLLFRKHIALLVGLPLFLLALGRVPQLRPRWRGVLLWLALPVASVALSAAQAALVSEAGIPVNVAPGAWSYGPLLVLISLTAATLMVRRGLAEDPTGSLGLLAALCIGAAIALPLLLATMASIEDHYLSSGAAFFTHSRGMLVTARFVLLCLATRFLGPTLFLAMLVGLPFALGPAGTRGRLALWTLACALLTAPLFYHARYAFPLVPAAVLIATAWLPRIGRYRGRALLVLLLLPALVRLFGWGLPVPRMSPNMLADESISLQQHLRSPELRHQLEVWFHPLYTVAPNRDPDLIGEVLAELAPLCAPRCVLGIGPPPRDVSPRYQGYDEYAFVYHLAYRSPVPGLSLRSEEPTEPGALRLLLYADPKELQQALAGPWELASGPTPFGNIERAILRRLPDGAGAPSAP